MIHKYGCLLLLLMLISLSGCGDLFKKEIIKKGLESGRLRADCELEMDEFALFLKQDITASINCLEENLNIFINVSELGRGGRLSRTSLLNYLKRNRPELKPNAFAIINSVFSMSNLITGESRDFISKKNVGLMFQLARTFNKHAARNYSNTFGSTAPATLAVHESHRRRIEDAANDIKKTLEAIYIPDRGTEIHFLDILDIAGAFVTEEDDDLLEKIEGVLFVKKIIVGGDPRIINHKEIGFLFQNFPKLLSLGLDAVRYKYLKLEQEDMHRFVHDDVIDLSNILFHPARGDRRFEPMFHVDMALEGIDRFIKEDDKKFAKYQKLVKEVKKILTKKRETSSLDEDEEWVTGGDLERIFNHTFNITKKAMAFHRLYNSPLLKPLLDAPQSVYLDPKKYELDFPFEKAELPDFCRIINTYRYMRGKFDLPYYSLENRRNADATGEIMTFEYLIKTAFGYYGSSLSMGDKQLREIMKRFENELIDLNIILPRRARNTAETISLLGSLFQFQSDDNKVLDVDEATEFTVTLMAGMDSKKVFMDYFKVKTQEDAHCKFDEFNRIDAGCFNKYFFNGLCENYRQYLPRLFAYLGIPQGASCKDNFNTPHNSQYLVASAQAARFCHIYPDDKTEIEYSESDIMSILIAMMHIETTIARWDINNNNQMDPNEVLNAFTIYQPAIKGMLPDAIAKIPPKMQDYLAKVVYQYLVKFEATPKFENGKDIVQLLGNLVKLIAKKAPATRKTIASILRVVSEESGKKAASEGEKPFDCSWMRDPENIPRD
jgi:hypothetical protein